MDAVTRLSVFVSRDSFNSRPVCLICGAHALTFVRVQADIERIERTDRALNGRAATSIERGLFLCFCSTRFPSATFD
jgi:hypothetical protein